MQVVVAIFTNGTATISFWPTRQIHIIYIEADYDIQLSLVITAGEVFVGRHNIFYPEAH